MDWSSAYFMAYLFEVSTSQTLFSPIGRLFGRLFFVIVNITPSKFLKFTVGWDGLQITLNWQLLHLPARELFSRG